MTVKRGLVAALSMSVPMMFAGALLWKGSVPARAQALVSCTFSFPGAGIPRLLSIPNEAQFQVGANVFGPHSPTPLASEVLAAIPGALVAQWVDMVSPTRTAYCWPTASGFPGAPYPPTDCVDQFGTVGVAVDFQVASLASLIHVADATTPASVIISGQGQPTPPATALAGGVTHSLTGPFAWSGQPTQFFADDLADELLVPPPVSGTYKVLRYLPTSPPTVEFWTGSAGANFVLECDEAFELSLPAPADYYWP